MGRLDPHGLFSCQTGATLFVLFGLGSWGVVMKMGCGLALKQNGNDDDTCSPRC